MSTISLVNTINVTLAQTPTGLGDFATNNICLFTNEVPLSVQPYIWAISASDIISEYGSDALTSAMGTAMFMPAPNLITGKGQVIVYPFNGVDATSAYIQTHPITNAMLATLTTITNGTMTLAIDGTQYTATGLNFSSVTTISDIVTVLQNANLDCDISIVNTNQIQFTSRRAGATDSSISAVAPDETTAGTAGTLTTSSIDTNISHFATVTNGCLNLYVDGIQYLLTGINCSTVGDVAALINSLTDYFTAHSIKVALSQDTPGQLVITSEAIGGYSSVQIGTFPTLDLPTDGIDIGGKNYLDGETCASVNGTYPTYSVKGTIYPYLLNNDIEVAGTDSSGTTLAEAIAAAEEQFYFGGILTTQICENARVLTNAQYVQTTDHIYFEGVHSLNNMNILGEEISSQELTKTRLLEYSMDDWNAAKQAIACYASIACSSNYSGTDTALTMNLKTLTGISADTNLNQTWYNTAKLNGVDIYGSTGGLSCVYSFSNGKYTDEATMDLWLKKALEVAGFNYLRQTNTKVPQTNKGVTGLVNAYRSVLEQGVRNGCIGAGNTWNEAIPFGDPEIFEENIEKFGYYIYHIPVAQQAQTERANREAPLIQIAIKRSGAIHSSNLIVNIEA